MTGLEILNNTFFSFWYILGEYFILLMGFALTISLVAGVIHILTKK